MKEAAIGIIIFNSKTLLVNRRFPPKVWAPPGGFPDFGENHEEAVVREAQEETGIQCKVISKIHEFEYNQSNISVYACQYISGELSCSYESLEVAWFEIDNLPSPISPERKIFHMAYRVISQL